MEHLTYRIALDPSRTVQDHETLPVMQPEVGKWYAAYTWEVHHEAYAGGVLAIYMGNGQWADPDNPGVDYTNRFFKWCDYIALHS